MKQVVRYEYKQSLSDFLSLPFYVFYNCSPLSILRYFHIFQNGELLPRCMEKHLPPSVILALCRRIQPSIHASKATKPTSSQAASARANHYYWHSNFANFEMFFFYTGKADDSNHRYIPYCEKIAYLLYKNASSSVRILRCGSCIMFTSFPFSRFVLRQVAVGRS